MISEPILIIIMISVWLLSSIPTYYLCKADELKSGTDMDYWVARRRDETIRFCILIGCLGLLAFAYIFFVHDDVVHLVQTGKNSRFKPITWIKDFIYR